MMLSSGAVDRMCGYRLQTTAELIAAGLLDPAAPDAAPGPDHGHDAGDDQRGQQHGGREEERGTPLVSVAPFSELARRYGQDLAIILIDSHPDIGTPQSQYPGYHAMAVA